MLKTIHNILTVVSVLACAVGIAARRPAGFEAGDILGDLLDQRQMLGKWR